MVDDRTPDDQTPPVPGQPLTPPNLGGQPAPSGMSGCAKAALIIGAVVLVVGVVLVGLLIVGVMRFADDLEGAFEGAPCRYMTDEEASDAIGAPVQAVSGDSALGAVLGLIRDTRLLADSPSCYISNEGSDIQVWISVHDGGDAAQVFAAGAAVAAGQVVSSTETDSGTITVETEPFRGEDVPGLGAEAFCVEVGPTVSGGVFARSEERVVFVTALAAAEAEGGDLFDGSLCQRAVPLARALLG
ncbi:MAG: hypothetical protein ACRDZM_00390 [Acidimicrobiia bacterium]